jgi:cytochrome c biogenesis factor
MNRKQKRLSIIAAGAVFLAGAAALVTSALREQIVFFNSPTDVLAQPLAPGTRVRLGGLVEEGTVQRGENSAVTFQVTDTNASVKVRYVALTHAYVVSDFSVQNVVENSHSLKPLLFKITGVWGNHEGSMLLWVLILALFRRWWRCSAAICRTLKANVLAVQAWITVAFLLFVVLTSNPFSGFPAPLEGNDLNPILQDIGLAIHPPLLYLGYVGFRFPSPLPSPR